MILENDTKAARQQFLKSLRIPDTNKRKTEIAYSHAGTFEWILERENLEPEGTEDDDRQDDQDSESEQLHTNCQNDETERFWTDLGRSEDDKTARNTAFVDWLINGSGNYWICGSPGSGKSTLMRFIARNDLSRVYLTEWARNREVYVAEAYIWNVGSEYQKTYKDVLATILFQMVELVDCVALGSLIRSLDDQNRASITDWYIEEIEQQILKLVEFTNRYYCLFIDGLDELEVRRRSEDDRILLRFIDRISTFSNVKCCLSSRPEQVFEVCFHASDKLRLEKFNASDIKLLCTHRLKNAFRENQKTIDAAEQSSVASLVFGLVQRANGAFLWAHLVLGQICQGIRARDEVAELYEYLDSLPSEISKLYEHMWAKNNDDLPRHRAEAANYLSLVVCIDRLKKFNASNMAVLHMLNPVQVAFTCDQRLQNDHAALPSPEEVVKICRRVEDRICIRSAGLLQTVEINDPWLPPVAESGFSANMRTLRQTRVEFVHRTTKDFLLTESTGQKILPQATLSTDILIRRLFHALIQGESCSGRIIRYDWLSSFFDLLRANAFRPQPSETAEILRDLESSCSDGFRRFLCKSPDLIFQHFMTYILDRSPVVSYQLIPLDFNALAFSQGTSVGVLTLFESNMHRLNPAYCAYLLRMLGKLHEMYIDPQFYKLVSILLEQLQHVSDDAIFVQCWINCGTDSRSGIKCSISHALVKLTVKSSSVRIVQHFDQALPLVSAFLSNTCLQSTEALILAFSKYSLTVKLPPFKYLECNVGAAFLVHCDLREMLYWYQLEGRKRSRSLPWTNMSTLSGHRWETEVKTIARNNNESWRRPSDCDCDANSTILSRLPFLPYPFRYPQVVNIEDSQWKHLFDQTTAVWERSLPQE